VGLTDDRSGDGIGVVLVNYATDPEVLRRTLAALLVSTSVASRDKIPLIEIVVVDNASPRYQEAAAVIVSELDRAGTVPLRWIGLASNGGFSVGVNTAIAALDPRCTLVFLCNPDATVEPDALARCASALTKQPDGCISAAPKMVLERTTGSPDPTPVLDSVGHVVNERGEAFNIGLGQPDLGQYDVSGPCFGPCFGAAMVRRVAFDPSAVGPLDESLFLYYEDVDWNWRAQLLGFDSITAPDARVHHVMSHSMRDRPYGDKFEFTERNLILCVLKNFSLSRALPVAARRSLGLAKGSLTGRHYPIPGAKALGGVVTRLPSVWRSRRDVQRRRVRSDAQILQFAQGERIFFDSVTYEPTERAAAEAFAREKLNRLG
jgi:GT2 family glycosyltransferase